MKAGKELGGTGIYVGDGIKMNCTEILMGTRACESQPCK